MRLLYARLFAVISVIGILVLAACGGAMRTRRLHYSPCSISYSIKFDSHTYDDCCARRNEYSGGRTHGYDSGQGSPERL